MSAQRVRSCVYKKKTKSGVRWYVRVWVDGRLYENFGGHRTKAEAQRTEREARESLRVGPLETSSSNLKLEEFFESWWKQTKHKLKASTAKNYEYSYRARILPALGHKYLADLTPSDVQEFITNAYESGLSPRTVKYIYNRVSACLAGAVNFGFLEKTPCRGISLPRVPRRERTILQPPEFLAVLDEVNDKYRTIFAVSGMAGTRIGETVALTWRDVDFETNSLRINKAWSPITCQVEDPKSAASFRQIPLFPPLRSILLEYRDQCDHTGLDDYLFRANSGNKPMHYYSVEREFGNAVEKTGLPHVTYHTLRHLFVSVLCAAGYNLFEIKEMTGHEDIGTLLRDYGHEIKSASRSDCEVRAEQIFLGRNGD